MTTLTSRNERVLPWIGEYAALAGNDEFTSAPTVREALIKAGLDWEAKKVPVYDVVMDENGVGYREIPDQVHLRRSDNNGSLLVVGKDYTPFQNYELAEFTDSLCDMADVEKAGIGEVKKGKRVFTVLKIKDDVVPHTEKGKLGTFIININGHGGRGLQCQVFTVDWACLNGQVAIVPDTAWSWSLKHTKNLHQRVAFQRGLMANAVQYVHKTYDLYEQLINTPLVEHDVLLLNRKLFPSTDKMKPAARTRQRDNRSDVLRTWRNSTTIPYDLRRTAWGYLHAVSEWDQYSERANARRRTDPMTRLVENRWGRTVNRARDLVLAE